MASIDSRLKWPGGCLNGETINGKLLVILKEESDVEIVVRGGPYPLSYLKNVDSEY